MQFLDSCGDGVRFVGRQPILDFRQKTVGYELLFRSSSENQFLGDVADPSRQMIDNVLTLGLEAIAPDGKAFVNCNREVLTEGLVTLLPVKSTVLEVLESVAVDDEVVAACAELKEMGYGIALDDYIPSQGMDRLLEFADYAKLDFRRCDSRALKAIRLHLERREIALIAEKIETCLEFEQAIFDGYTYFQGYFFARPTILQSRKVPANKMLYVQLLGAVSSSPCDLALVERLVITEASLCFRLLRLVNSAGLGIRNPVRTVRQALLMIGEDEFRKMILVASAAALGSDGSSELILLALQRAHFCESIASRCGQLPGEQYLIGLLSLMDAMLLVPIERVTELLPLTEETTAVLLGEESPLAVPLRLAKAYEQKEWEMCGRLCNEIHLSETDLDRVYLASLRWGGQQVEACRG